MPTNREAQGEVERIVAGTFEITITQVMVERACQVQHVGWNLWHEPQKKTAREVMCAALSAALTAYTRTQTQEPDHG